MNNKIVRIPPHTLKGGIPNNKYWCDAINVGKLKDFIKKHKIPDDALILYQRIDDVYFKKHGWSKNSIKKKDPEYNNNLKKAGFKEVKDEYVVVFGYVGYKDKNLYLTAHY